MKVILNISIYVKGKGLHTTVQKEHDIKLFPPSRGTEIKDSAWKDPMTPTSIILNFDDQYYYLTFPEVELDTKDQCKDEVKMYKSHGWNDLIPPSP